MSNYSFTSMEPNASRNLWSEAEITCYAIDFIRKVVVIVMEIDNEVIHRLSLQLC